MGRIQFRGRGALVWLPSCANKAAPTIAEITAGVRLTPLLTNSGLKTPNTGNTIDVSDASDLFNKTSRGSHGGDMGEVTCYRETVEDLDLAWATLVEDADGFLLVARNGLGQDADTGLGTPGGTPIAGDRCEVYPASVISRAMVDLADGTANQFAAAISFPDSPELNAVVAAA